MMNQYNQKISECSQVKNDLKEYYNVIRNSVIPR